MKKWALLTLVILLLFSSCTSEEGNANASPNTGINPDFILTEAKYTLGQDGEKPLFLEANELIIYNDDDMAYATDLTFYQVDDDGNKTLTGTAGYAIIDTESKSANFSKGVELVLLTDDMIIKAESLFFDTEKQTFESKDEINAKKDNITIIAKGIFGNLVTSEFEFEKIEKGEIIL